MQTVVTADQLQAWWQELNARFFDNCLPPIIIHWSQRLTSSSGMFVSALGPRAIFLDSAQTFLHHRAIRLSIPLLARQAASETLNTLAHEMIHQWQFDLRKRRPNHGRDFRRMMAAMNQHGLNITVRHALNDAEALSKYMWHCVNCGRVYRRYRRSIRPNRHRCGVCAGRLKELPLATVSG